MASAQHQNLSNSLEATEFKQYVEDLLSSSHTPGISIAVIHKDNTWARGFGYARNPGSKDAVPVTEHTLFHAGSTTKSFTAALASLLVNSDHETYSHINWDTKLVELIREDFVLQDEYATNHITIRDALSHRTGFPGHDVSWLNGGNATTHKEIVRRMRHLPMWTELRQGWSYCNPMFIAVGHALETVTGEDMGKLLHEKIWKPLGMERTTWGLDTALEFENRKKGEINLARPYLWNNECNTYSEFGFEHLPPANGAGGNVATALDYTRWMRALLYADKNSSSLPSQALKDIVVPQMLLEEPTFFANTNVEHPAYALGLETGTYRGYTYIGHPGSLNGYLAAMFWFPDLEWGFVGFQNGWSFTYMAVMYRLLDDLLDSVGARGERTDILAVMGKQEVESRERVKNGRKTVYPNAPDQDLVAPSLPLSKYEGTYRHPAYQNITLKMQAPNASEEGLPGAPIPLEGVGSKDGYLKMTWTFHHVSAERWWVLFKLGEGSWMIEMPVEARFEVGVQGEVKGLWLQAEKRVKELALFEKVA